MSKSLAFITSALLQTLLKQDFQAVSHLRISQSTIKLFILQSKLRHQIMDQLAQSDRWQQIGSGMSHMIRTQPRESFIMWLITCIFPCSPLWQLINTSTKAIQGSSRRYLCQEERPWGFWQRHDALYSQNLNICFHFNCKLKHIVETTEQLHKRQASHTFGPINFHDLSGNARFPKRRAIKIF